MSSRIRDMTKELIYFGGDLRREHAPLGFAWGKYESERLISYEEMEEICTLTKPGMIGLHRNRGDLSNVFLPGFMKHTFNFVESRTLVEAVSEGVLKRHAFNALASDYVIILEPKIDDKAKQDAVDRWLCLVGSPYDDRFQFDLEKEDEIFKDKTTAIANMQKFGLGISCSESTALGLVGHRKELGIFRTKLGRKRQVILPDAYLSTHFNVIYTSKFVTVDLANKLGLGDEGCTMISDYLKKR